MSELCVTQLEDLYQSGLAAARLHFVELVHFAVSVLPSVINSDIPKSMEDLGGLFSASTSSCYLILLRDREDYFPVQAEFKCTDGQWALERFSVNLGMFSGEIAAKRFEDILIMSRKIARLKKDHSAMDMMAELKQSQSVVQ